jgi:hypothetical protein
MVAEATSATSDIAKTTFQALFSKQARTSTNGIKGIPLTDLCFSLVKQMDVMKKSSNFILKQLLMSNNAQGRKMVSVLRVNESLKHENTNIKQSQSTQRIQYEQIQSELKNRLDVKEIQIQEMNKQLEEKDRIIGQFRQMHNHAAFEKGNESNGTHETLGESRGYGQQTIATHVQNPYTNRNNMSSSASIASSTIASSRMESNGLGGGGGGGGGSGMDQPFKGFLAQQQAKQVAAQQQYMSRRGPIPSSNSSIASSRVGINSNNYGNSGGVTMMHHKHRHGSNHSIGSGNSGTPKIRDYSQGSMFNFQGSSGSTIRSGGSGGGGGRLNKRRRPAETPASQRNMSPNTAFTLNQGSYSAQRNYPWRS